MIAVYARVSTEDQAKHGYSLAEQIRACKEKAGTDDVLEYIDEGISGAILERPALEKLRKDVKDGLITRIICLAPDRLSRDQLHAQILLKEFLRHQIKPEFVKVDFDDSPMGLFNYQILTAVAELEKATIKERTVRGRREKARQGKVVKNYHIYGYDYDQDQGKLVINEREAAIVRLIFDLFTGKRKDIEAKGINGIAHYLSQSGVPTKKNSGVWHRQVVRQILMNSVYKGEFYQNRWNTEGMLANKFAKSDDEKVRMTLRPREEWILVPSPVIIQPEQFDYAQKLLSESRRRYNGSERYNYFLSGLLRCGDCGNTMTGRRSKNWGIYVREYTDIKNTAGTKNRGCGNKIKCEELDKHVWQAIVERMKASKEIAATAEAVQEEISFEQAEIERIEKEIERLKKGRDRLLTLLMEADDDLANDLKAKIKETKEQEAQLVQQKAALEELLARQRENQFAQDVVQEARERFFAKSEEEWTDEERRGFVREIVREIRVYKDGRVQIFGI
jgi:site-specific DNA recombinase